MKEFKLKLAGLLAICAFSVLGYTQMNHSEKLDDLKLENIEALATDEEIKTKICIGSGSIVCPQTDKKVDHVRIYYSLPR